MPNAKELFMRANFERKNGHLPIAEALFRKALEKDPKFWDAWNSLGCLYLDDLHEYPEAERIFKRCIELNPNHEWGYSNLACVYCETQQWDLAKKFAEIALHKRVYGDALVSLGRAHLGVGNIPDAIRILEEASHVPNYPYPHYYLALAYEQIHDNMQVIRYLKTTLNIQPGFKDAQQKLDAYYALPPH